MSSSSSDISRAAQFRGSCQARDGSTIRSICFGARTEGGTSNYWGIDLDAQSGCTGCCYSYGGTSRNINLTCPGGNDGTGGGSHDLAVRNFSVSDIRVQPGQTITLSADVYNWSGSSPSTTLTWYRSDNSTITSRDTRVGADSVGRLGSRDTSSESIRVTVPRTAGTYYCGACVPVLSNEDDPGDECSDGVAVVVASSGGGGGAGGGSTYGSLELTIRDSVNTG